MEVKSTISQAELNKAYAAAGVVRALRPFKSHFVAPKEDGAAAADGTHRCMYVIVGYRWRLDAINHQNISRSFRSFEPEAQLVLNGRNPVGSQALVTPAH